MKTDPGGRAIRWPMIVIEPAFEEGTLLYVKSDPNQHPRQVVGYQLRHMMLHYLVVCDGEETVHVEYELSRRPRSADKNDPLDHEPV